MKIPAEVRCYSGHTYAERPVSFTCDGREHEVKSIEKAWYEPGERHFRVANDIGDTYELVYDEENDSWYVVKCSESCEGR